MARGDPQIAGAPCEEIVGGPQAQADENKRPVAKLLRPHIWDRLSIRDRNMPNIWPRTSIALNCTQFHFSLTPMTMTHS